MSVISFGSSDQVRAWSAKSDELGEQAYTAMRDTQQILNEIAHDSEGAFVQDLVNLTNSVLEVADKVVKTFKDLTETINQISNAVEKAADAVQSVIGGVGKAISGLFGG